MAREAKTIQIHLERLRWEEVVHRNGNGHSPQVDPYLWTVFFKADGSSLYVTDAGTVSGSATTFTTLGSHGNLCTRPITAGQSIIIPPDIGLWTDRVVPIPVATSLQPIVGEDFPAFFGVVAVLMRAGGHVSDHGAEAGHRALNYGIQQTLDELLQLVSPTHPIVTEEDVATVGAGIEDRVANAIVDAQLWFENLWSLSGKDQSLRQQTFCWNQDSFPGTECQLRFTNKWPCNGFGDWTIDGSSVVATSPASVFA